MRPERIEELLRSRPPDERQHGVELGPDPVAPAVEPMRPVVRARLGRAVPALVVVVAVVATVATAGLLAARRPDQTATSPGASGAPPSVAGPSPAPSSSAVAGLIPWLDAPYVSPSPEPTPGPGDLPLCDAANVALLASGWGGATGSMAGGVQLVSLAADPCRLENPTRVELLDAAGTTIATGPPSGARPPDQGAVEVAPGAVAGDILVWSNWCGTRPARPLSVRLTLPLAVDQVATPTTLMATIDDDGLSSGTPRCDAPGAGPTLGPIGLTAEPPMLGDYPRDECAPTGLVAFRSPWGAGLGTSYSRIVVVNHSSFDCTLPATMTVELRDHGGSLLLHDVASTDAVDARALPAGGTLVITIGFADWCLARPATPLTLDVAMASGRVAVASAPAAHDEIPVPACMSGGAPPAPAFFVDSLVAPPVPEPPASDPGDALPLRVDVAVPGSAVAGTDLAYTVTLTNIDVGGKPVDLPGGCPSYVERLFLPDRRETTARYLLNCAGAGPIGAGESRTFEMRIAVPRDAGVGQATLLWQLGDRGPNSPKVPVAIAAP